MMSPQSLASAAIALAVSLLPVLSSCSRAGKTAYQVAAPQQEIDQTHTAFTAVLKSHLRGHKVDYTGLKKNPGELNAYLDTLAAVPETTFNQWNRNQQMAFLINLYNAATLKLVVDHYPLDSIRDIGNILKGPWKQEVVRLFGKIETLDHIEHDLLRPNYKDPRVHFAVNCASIGCPSLRAEAFQAAKLDEQLDEQGRLFLADTSKNRLDAKNKVLHLSPIFDWFKEDFTGKSGSVEKFIAPYFPESDRAMILSGDLKITNTDYDWKLNKL